MATRIQEKTTVETIDGILIEVQPLKIKYLREFMEEFQLVKTAQDDNEATGFLVGCARVAMKQFYPEFDTDEKIEDNFDMHNLKIILDYSAGIKMDLEEENLQEQATSGENMTWETLDLAKLEAEVFLLGIWKDFEELERCISMFELNALLESKREKDYSDKKFTAALKGIDLDEQTGQKEDDPWEAMKARVFGGTSDPNDILAYQGVNANKAGFGIGMGLDYEKVGS
jgi:hypothetical protein